MRRIGLTLGAFILSIQLFTQTLVANIEQGNQGSEPRSLNADKQFVTFFATVPDEGVELFYGGGGAPVQRFPASIPGELAFQNPNAIQSDGRVYFALFDEAAEAVRYYRADLAAGTLTNFVNLPGDINFPDPRFTVVDDGGIFFVHGASYNEEAFYLVDTADNLVQLPSPNNEEDIEAIRPTGDGRIVITYGYTGEENRPLTVVDPVAKVAETVYPDPAFDYLAFTTRLTDGRLLFNGSQPTQSQFGYFVADSLLTTFTPLAEAVTGLPPGRLVGFTTDGDDLYFVSRTEDRVNQLWRTDLTLSSFTRLSDLSTPADSVSSVINLSPLAGRLYYQLYRSDGRLTLHVTDGTAAEGTRELLTVGYPGGLNLSDLGRPVQLTNGDVYFLATNGPAVTSGIGIFRTDGTPSGTVRTADLGERLDDRGRRRLVPLADKLYFIASDPLLGEEVHVSDGTAAGTGVLLDINTRERGSFPRPLLVYDDTLLLAASTACTGFELFASGGTAASTRLVADLVPGVGSSGLYTFQTIGDTLYLSAFGDSETPVFALLTPGMRVIALDSTQSEQTLLGPVYRSPIGQLGGRLLLRGFLRNGEGQVLYTYEPATRELQRIFLNENAIGLNGSGLFFEALSDTVALFEVSTEETGTQIWRTDGTEAGTYRLTTRPTGSYLGGFSGVTVIDGTGYFTIHSEDFRKTTLWRSDGTTEGTYPLWNRELRAVGPIFAYDGAVHFFANDYGGYRLYRAEGRNDMRESAVTSGQLAFNGVSDIAVSGDRLVFAGTAEATGTELWGTTDPNGPATLLADLYLGPQPSYPRSLYVFNDSTIFFSAEVPELGRELWQTDGTAAGTLLVADINPGTASSDPDNFLRYRDFVYFQADDGRMGSELWKYTPTDPDNDGTGEDPNEVPAVCSADSTTTATHGPAVADLQLAVFPNPTSEQLTLTREQADSAMIDLYTAGGERVYHYLGQWQQHTVPVSRLPAGDYVLRVTTRDGRQGTSRVIAVVH